MQDECFFTRNIGSLTKMLIVVKATMQISFCCKFVNIITITQILILYTSKWEKKGKYTFCWIEICQKIKEIGSYKIILNLHHFENVVTYCKIGKW